MRSADEEETVVDQDKTKATEKPGDQGEGKVQRPEGAEKAKELEPSVTNEDKGQADDKDDGEAAVEAQVEVEAKALHVEDSGDVSKNPEEEEECEAKVQEQPAKGEEKQDVVKAPDESVATEIDDNVGNAAEEPTTEKIGLELVAEKNEVNAQDVEKSATEICPTEAEKDEGESVETIAKKPAAEGYQGKAIVDQDQSHDTSMILWQLLYGEPGFE